ncbi:MAG: PAS domain S-box protein [Scytolyngbya sp. HA4215-MV1]|jgi:hypothetical protein|nr:PAS domain S-box protein [Scytolyngbya sp. HA4215-MV1]
MSRQISQVAIAFVILMGGLFLLGCQFNLSLWESRFLESLACMKVDTALCFLLAGLALGLTQVALSHRQQAETALQESQAHFAGILAIASDAIISVDANQRIILFNQGAETIFGYSAPEILGQPLDWLLPDRFIQTHRQHINQFAASSSQARKMGERGKILGRRKDGTEFPAEASISQLQLASGQIFTIFLRDVSERQQAEEKLRETTATLESIIHFSPLAIVVLDIGGHVKLWNSAAENLFGWKEAEVKGKPLPTLPTQEITQFNRELHQVKQGQRFSNLETLRQKKDGSLVTISLSVAPLFDAEGSIIGSIGMIADITDRKRTEAALRVSEERWQFALEGCGDGVWDWDIQTNQIFYSRRWKEMLGYTEAEISDSLNEWEERIHPEDKDRVLAETAKHLNGQTPCFFSEYRFQCRDGRYIWILDRGLVVKRSSEGQPLRVIGTHSDITDRKQVQKELELQAVVTRNMAEGICLVRVDDGMIVYANPKFEQMFGYELGELTNQHVSIVNYGDTTIDPEVVNQSIRSAVLQRGEATYQVHNVKKDGTPFWCEATTSVFEHAEYGTVLVAVQQDITERKQAEERIQASLKEKEVLLKEIHHRVKNNLQIIDSLLQMQVRRIQEPQISAILKDSQNRVASIALVHEKLYGSEDLANIDLAQYIPDLAFHLFSSYKIYSSQIRLKTKVDSISLEVSTVISCGLIINELVSNALKYAFLPNQSGEVAVELHAEPDNILKLVVRDNGRGLPAGFHLESTPSLGLTLVQGLVDQLNGTLELTSTEGTEFKITFPFR